MKKMIHYVSIFISLLLITFSSCQQGIQKVGKDSLVKSWYYSDSLARELSQLDSSEVEFMDGSDLINHQPVILPTTENIVTINDYFDWPVATKIDSTIIVLYDRRNYHFGPKPDEETQNDIHSGIRMIISSDDGGKTWNKPVDVFEQAGHWDSTVFFGWGGGVGTYQGIAYLALNEGVYKSLDKGKTWQLINPVNNLPGEIYPVNLVYQYKPWLVQMNDQDTTGYPKYWSPGLRITFDKTHGMTIWTSRDFKPSGRDGRTPSDYSKFLSALYSPDFGTTWKYQEQALPEGLNVNELTPVPFDGKMAFFFRNGQGAHYYGQGYSETGWFPFNFAVTSNVGPTPVMDTPDCIYNPVTKRLEATVTIRTSVEGDPMRLDLYSIDPNELAAGSNTWNFEGVLLKYRSKWGISDGMNPVAGIVDEKVGMHRIYVWGGDCRKKSGIFELSRSLNTPMLSKYLKESRK